MNSVQDFIEGEKDRYGKSTDGTWYDDSVDAKDQADNHSSQFSEGAKDPYEVKHAKNSKSDFNITRQWAIDASGVYAQSGGVRAAQKV